MTSEQQNDRVGAGLPPVPSIPLTEDRLGNGLPPADQSIGTLVKDATTHLSTLVRAEIELAKGEIGRDVKRGLRGSVFFIIALTIFLFSLFFLFFALAELFADIGFVPRSGAFGIVFGLMLLTAGFAGYLGYKKVRGIKGPRRTISTMRDNASAFKRGDDDKGDETH